jgi:hypothetical protein
MIQLDLGKNLPGDSRILVNAFFAYGGSLIAGSDAGWWLPYLAGRETNLPPLSYGTEAGPSPDYRIEINELQTQIERNGITSPEVLSELNRRNISHVYIGQARGQIGSPSAYPAVLRPETLQDSSNFQAVYHQDQVWIFAVVP